MTELDIDRREVFAREVVERLRARSYEALWAGGCVRDRLLGIAPKDFDIATSATPEQVRETFGHRKTLAVGAAFGVIVVVGSREQGTIEVATFRRDTTYSDGRRPDAVIFSTPEEDASRRDFTINGLFFDPLAERVIDYVGGVGDLKRGIVRAIGDPRERFHEDKLRLLRAVRMASRFNFALDQATQLAVTELADTVTTVSPERIGQEMRAMLTIGGRKQAMRLLVDTRLMPMILPEILTLMGQPCVDANSDADAWTYMLDVLSLVERPTVSLCLAVVVHLLGDALGAIDAANGRWRLSNKEVERAKWLAQHVRGLVDASSRPWSQVQPLLVHEGIGELLDLHAARARAAAVDLGHVDFCRTQLARAAKDLDPPPLVTGHDLLKRGLPAGRDFARWLASLRAAQLDGLIHTRDDAIALVEKWRQEG